MKRFLISLTCIVLCGTFLYGCGQKETRKTASILTDDELEMLASLDDGIGSAQTAVEIIPAPPVRIAPMRVESNIPVEPVVIKPEAPKTSTPKASAPKTSAPTPKPASPTSKILSFEQKVQVALNRAGYYNGSIDGKVGTKTRQALKSFQKANGLTADGLVGPRTWEQLRGYYYRESGSDE